MADPGLTLTEQQPATADAGVVVDGQPPSDLWRDIARTDGFQEFLVRTIRKTFSERTATEVYHLLEEVGVAALDGAYADLCIRVARGDERALWTLLRTTADFGQPRSRRTELGVGIDAPLQAVSDGPLAVLGLAGEPATITARVRRTFEDQRAEQRRAVCRLLAALAQVCDLRIVASSITARFLRQCHREDLPGVSETYIGSRGAGRIADLVEQAYRTLDPTGRPVSILREIAGDPATTRSYHALAANTQVSRARVRQCVGQLRDHELVATFDGPDGTTVELLPTGGELIARLDRQIGRQRRLDDCVSEAGQSTDHGRVTPPAHEGTSSAEREGESDAVASAEDEEYASRRDWVRGPVDVRYLSRREHAAAVASARTDGIGLVDHPIEPQTDGRQPGWSYDEDVETLAVTAEYHNPCQYAVATARALASEKTFQHVLTPDRLDGEHGDLSGLNVNYIDVLRNARNLGWLPDRAVNGEGYVEQLRGAREDLLDLARKMCHADRQGDDERYSALRSELTSLAHGLAGTIVHLLDLVGVDVVHEVRLPHFRRDRFSDDAFRADLAEHLATRISIQSRYAQFVTYRQLYESRPQKRENSLSVTVDAADPFGSLVGSIAVVGPGVTDLEADLRQAVRNPAEIHENAPEFALRVPINDRTDARPAYAQVVTSLCRAKAIRPTRAAVSIFRAVTGSPYDVAAALAALAPETKAPGREIHLDEIRYALSSLDPSRILPATPPTVSKVVHALLKATEPLSQRELADRAAVSTKSVRRHRGVLEALDLVREVDRGLRFSLPFRKERGSRETKAILPWYAVDSPDREWYLTLGDVLFEVVVTVIDEPARLGDPTDPIGGPFFAAHTRVDLDQLTGSEALPWLAPWVRVVETLLDRGNDHENEVETETPDDKRLPDSNAEPRSVIMGEIPSQTALSS